MPTLVGSTQDEVRRSNLSLVLTLLHRRGALSRSQITAISGLNRSTVGALVAELSDCGLVREQGGVARGVGRPSLLVEPVAESAVVLTLDVRVERTVAAVVGLGGEVFVRQERRHREAVGEPARILSEMTEIAREVLGQAPSGSAWIGTGIGIPGVVRAEDGLVRQAPNLGWVDVPLRTLISEDFNGMGGGVWIRNDADLGALAEHLRGAAHDADNVVFLAGDVGIGGGVIVDSAPLVGAGGYGGEVGHMRVNPSGRMCRCGARGCWETEIGAEALVDSVRRSSGSTASAADILFAAREGDPVSLQAVSAVADWLGVGLVNLVHLLNPQAVVLGGHLAEVYAMASEQVVEHLDRALPAAREQVQVMPARLRRDATLIGGAEVAFTALLADPVSVMSQARDDRVLSDDRGVRPRDRVSR